MYMHICRTTDFEWCESGAMKLHFRAIDFDNGAMDFDSGAMCLLGHADGETMF